MSEGIPCHDAPIWGHCLDACGFQGYTCVGARAGGVFTLKVQLVLVALLAIAPSPHLPQLEATSEAAAVPTNLQQALYGVGLASC